MESLFLIGILAFLAGPVLAIIALVQLSNLSVQVTRLKREVERLGTEQSVVAQPPPIVEKPDPVVKAASPKAEEEILPQAAVQEPHVQSPTPPPKRDVEQALASRWFVWVGGVAVALGGLLFVKYAHDNGLIPPMLRVIIGLGFGGALVAAGEWVRKRDDALSKGYVPAALSAAGLTISFGVVYAAYALYGILGPALCFPLLVAIGLAALWLSRRQGPFIAALGLVGSFAAPALVPSAQPSAYGFFAYLIVIVAASLYELRGRPWWWLGYAALAGATLWALLWVRGGIFDPSHVLPTGLFALLMGAAATVIPAGRGILAADMGTLAEPAKLSPPMRIAIAGLVGAGLVLATLVWRMEHGTFALLLFAIGMVAIAAFGWLRDGMVAAPIAAAFATLVVLMIWPDVGFHEWAMDERGLWSTVPGKIEPFRFAAAMFFALGVFLAFGLLGMIKREEPRPWAALAAGSAVLFLFGLWARADSLWNTSTWVYHGGILAVGLGSFADKIKSKSGRSAEILAIGAGLLALFAIDRMWDGVWQTLATSALAFGFAFFARRTQLQWIAATTAATASLAAIRLFVGREFWGEPVDVPLAAHWVLYGYGVPAILFFSASRVLVAEHFTRYRTALEGLALGLAISLVSLEIRVLIGGGITRDEMGLLEMSAHALAWLGAAYGLAYRQSVFSSFVSLWGARALLAAACAVFMIGLTVRNPVITGEALEGNVIFNSLWLAYLVPAGLLAMMARKLEGLGLAKFRNGLGVFLLLLLVAFITLQVKRLFQDETLEFFFVTDAESYTVSAAWIVAAVAIFIAGIWLARQNIRLAGLAFLVLAITKVLAFDLFELGGLWRIASVVGLGLCLIGVGWLYTRFVQRPHDHKNVTEPLTSL